MFATKRVRIAAAALTIALLSGGIAAAVTSTASASPRPKAAATSSSVTASPARKHHHPKLSLTRFDLNGYVIDAKYNLGRNTGTSYAIVDVFVMNFKTHTVYDFAPGSATPESAGTIKVVTQGTHRIP